MPPGNITAEEAQRVATAAVLERCRAVGIEAPNPKHMSMSYYQNPDGRWLFIFREANNRIFHVRVPPQRPIEEVVNVELQIHVLAERPAARGVAGRRQRHE